MNTFTMPDNKLEVLITKHWEDNLNVNRKRPHSIKYVLKGGNNSQEQTVTGSITNDENWKYIFKNLPKYNEQGNEIQYIVEEEEVNQDDLKFYTKQVNGDYKTGFNLINTFKIPEEEISVNVNKQWNDNLNSNQKRPSSIKYVLKGGSILKEQVVIGNRTTNEGWNYTFTNVPKYNEQGNEIQYIVEEQEINQNELKFYIKQVVGDYKLGFNIINTFKVPDEKISVNVKKQWKDNSNSNGKRPASIKYILKGGVGLLEQVVSGNSTNDNNWEYTFINLVKYNEQGNEIQYIVEEQEVNQDDLKFYVNEISGNYKTGINIVNTFTLPNNKIEVKVNKVWKDNSNKNKKRPTTIKYILKGGNVTQEQIVAGNLITDEGWSYTFKNLAKYNLNGNEILYTLEEQEENKNDLKFYTKQIIGDYKNSFNIVNTFKVPNEKILIAISSNWEDSDNKYGKRPRTIKYVLIGEGIVKEEIVSGNSITNEGWNYTFKNLPKYNEQGNEIKYTVREQEVNKDDLKYYTNKVIGDNKSGLNVINKYILLENKKEEDNNRNNEVNNQNQNNNNVNKNNNIKENMAKGKLPQTGEKVSITIISIVIALLSVITIVKIRLNSNKR